MKGRNSALQSFGQRLPGDFPSSDASGPNDTIAVICRTLISGPSFREGTTTLDSRIIISIPAGSNGKEGDLSSGVNSIAICRHISKYFFYAGEFPPTCFSKRVSKTSTYGAQSSIHDLAQLYSENRVAYLRGSIFLAFYESVHSRRCRPHRSAPAGDNSDKWQQPNLGGLDRHQPVGWCDEVPNMANHSFS